MATVYNPDSPPIKGATWSFDVSVISLALSTAFKTTVTLAAGDIQVSKDGAQYANLATFPPAERDYAGGGDSGTLRVVLTATEMTAGAVTVRFHDQTSPQEWADAEVTIYPVVAVTPDVNLAQILGAAITGTAAQIVAAFKKLFDVASPNLTAASKDQTGDAYAQIGVAGAGLTALGDTRLANLDATVSSRAAPGDAMTLPDDAITAGKFDQLTAFPLESADSGASKVARTGADSDTLETLSDQVDGLPTDQDVRDAMKLSPTAGSPAAGSVDTHLDDILADTGTDGVVVASLTTAAKALVQTEAEDALKAYDLDHLIETTAGSEEPTDGSYLDQIMHKNASQTFDASTDSLEAIRDKISSSTLTVVDAVDAGDLNITIAATYDGTPDGLTFSSDWEKVYFTLKKGAKGETDAEAICQIVVSATPAVTDGLLYLNGSLATALGLALTDGALTVSRAAGTCRILIDSSATALLSPAENLAFDIKEHTTAGKDNVVGSGTADIFRTPTRAIS